jgi:CHAT domain-containing protein
METRSGSATILLDSAATKKAFIRNSNHQDIIHLATHAFAPNGAGNKSFIAFYPSDKNIENAFLYAPEIYDLDLSNTQLVILSACETGAGDLVRGEGIMSISRAFAYAGCPNVITSLWKADDVSTGVIIESVNGYLQKGYSVDAALRSSKIDYLRDKKLNPRMKHPAYWSHIVFIGAYQKEDENNYRLLITCAGSVALVVAVWLFLRRRRRHAGIK